MSTTSKVILIDGKFPDYYRLLKVVRDASERDIVLAYRKLALNQHPDKAGGGQKQNETFSHINAARDVLTDSEKRRQYNVQLSKHEAAAQKARRQPPLKSKNTQKPVHKPAKPAASTRPAPRQQEPKPHSTWEPPDPTLQEPYYSQPSYNPTRSHFAFNRFSHPVSAHPPSSTWQHFGTKPDPESAWSRSVWKGSSLGKMHEAACHYASLTCEIAKGVQNIVINVERVAALNLNHPPLFSDPKNFRRRLGAGIELVVELVHFVAESYIYHEDQLDKTIYLPTASGGALIHEHGWVFEKLKAIMLDISNRLCNVFNLLRDRTKSVDAIFTDLVDLFAEWNAFCELPSNLLNGIDDTFFVEACQWRNNWVRRRAGEYHQFGYQSKRFVLYEEQKTGPQASDSQANGQQSHQQSHAGTSARPKEQANWQQRYYTAQPPKSQSWEQPKQQTKQQPNQQPQQPFSQQQNRTSDSTGFSGKAWGPDDWRNTSQQKAKEAGSKWQDWVDDSDLIE